jgi:ubiquinone/menaquinone biosynthesis C-methylase UbiE
VSEWLVERLAPAPGETILELAAGTGETGFLAAPLLQPGGTLITSDSSPAMLAAARRRAAALELGNVEFRQLDTTAIALPDGRLDGILSRFGYLLRGEPPRGLHEAARTLRPGGRIAFAVWAARERNPWMTVPVAVLRERGHLRPESAEQRRLSARRTPEAIAALLEQAGFELCELEEMPVSYRFVDADELWFFISELRGPLSLVVEQLERAEREAVFAEVEARAERRDAGYALGGVSINALARSRSAALAR